MFRKRHRVRIHQQRVSAVALRSRQADVHAADEPDIAGIRMHGDAIVSGSELSQQFVDRGVVRGVVDQPNSRVVRAEFIEMVEQRLDACLHQFCVPVDRDDDVEWTVHGRWDSRWQSSGGARKKRNKPSSPPWSVNSTWTRCTPRRCRRKSASVAP